MNVVISTHVYTTGPAQDLRDYLISHKIDYLLFIGHPLFYNKKLSGSGLEMYKAGKKIYEKYQRIRNIPEILSYIKDVFLNIIYVINSKRKYDLYVGSDNLNALSGILLKKLGYIKRVVYYVIDYNPHRFSNRFLNSIYHKIDQFCVRHADETWNLSPRMEWGRKKYFGFSGGIQKIVPVGVWLDRIKAKPYKQIEKHTLVFMGHVTKKQGIQKVITAIPKVIKRIPDFKFIIIGGGNYITELKELVNKVHANRSVVFTGYIENHEDIEKMLIKCAVAIAPYEKYDENGHLSFTYFADPAKIKLYLSSGLPVLLSKVPHNATDIVDNNCGAIIKNNIHRNIVDILKNEKKLETMREAAINYSRKFSWEKIFTQALNEKLG